MLRSYHLLDYDWTPLSRTPCWLRSVAHCFHCYMTSIRSRPCCAQLKYVYKHITYIFFYFIFPQLLRLRLLFLPDTANSSLTHPPHHTDTTQHTPHQAPTPPQCQTTTAPPPHPHHTTKPPQPPQSTHSYIYIYVSIHMHLHMRMQTHMHEHVQTYTCVYSVQKTVLGAALVFVSYLFSAGVYPEV